MNSTKMIEINRLITGAIVNANKNFYNLTAFEGPNKYAKQHACNMLELLLQNNFKIKYVCCLGAECGSFSIGIDGYELQQKPQCEGLISSHGGDKWLCLDLVALSKMENSYNILEIPFDNHKLLQLITKK